MTGPNQGNAESDWWNQDKHAKTQRGTAADKTARPEHIRNFWRRAWCGQGAHSAARRVEGSGPSRPMWESASSPTANCFSPARRKLGLEGRQKVAQGQSAKRTPPWVISPPNHPSPAGATEHQALRPPNQAPLEGHAPSRPMWEGASSPTASGHRGRCPSWAARASRLSFSASRPKASVFIFTLWCAERRKLPIQRQTLHLPPASRPALPPAAGGQNAVDLRYRPPLVFAPCKHCPIP